ncbi:methyltransferase, FxLD system [Streptomyces angustmyceticus]|uniref:methyltransferase, FxLD system n=1 Tax=Streptomyces angustmyceticus TaxID=285578 RepID=UPI003D8B6ADC
MNTTSTSESWSAHYAQGRGIRPLSEAEIRIVRDALAPSGDRKEPRALEVCCGTGELARLLAELGYAVDAVDFAQAAIDRAAAASGPGITYHCADVASDDVAALADGAGFDLITVRRSLAHLPDRTRIVTELAALLRPGGRLCVITPHADRFPPTLRDICLDNDEIALLTQGWEHAELLEAEDSTVVVLSGPVAQAAGYREKRPPKAAAMAGVAVVVTNAFGRVLLGWNPKRGVWELPAGKVEPGEAFEVTAVRELEEETGLRAEPDQVVLLSTVCDDTHGLTRVTEIARLTHFDGKPEAREPDLIARWEWHTPCGLRALPQPLFTPTAQALNTVWPGLLPHLPDAHHTPRPPSRARLRFAEPPAAARLREQLVRDLTDAGWTPTPELRRVFTVVPRHAFLPEQPLSRAYANAAVPTVTADSGQPLSSVSQPEMQAVMLSRGRLRWGGRALEIGGGGYNAALMAELVGPRGTVVCVEFDPYVYRRTVRFLEEIGYAGRVRVVLGDGAHGAPDELVPDGGFDTILVTVAANDIPEAWTAQLAEGGRLVVPLRLGGYTRCVALAKRGAVLTSTDVSVCGFVPMQGIGRWDDTPAAIGQSGYGIRWEDTPALPIDGLGQALEGTPVEHWTGVTVARGASYEDLQLWLAASLPGFCRLTADRDRPGPIVMPDYEDAAAMVTGRTLACLALRRIEDDEDGGPSRWEFGAQAFGPDAEAAADTVASAVHAWDRDIRPHGTPGLTVLPAARQGEQLPSGPYLNKHHTRVLLHLPTAPAAS